MSFPMLHSFGPKPLLLLLLVFCFTPFFTSCSISPGPRSHLTRAKHYAGSGDYKSAVYEYQRHIESRLESTTRPQQENPYFYYLLIGDLYLEQNCQIEARVAFEQAYSHGVNPDLVADRFRTLAKWYEKRKQYETAISLLREHRSLDPLLFDLDIDRIHKETLRLEDELEAKH